MMSWNALAPEIRVELSRRLSPRQHDVFVLWLAGCSYDRIATMLDIAPRTVRTHLKRARAIHDQLERKKAA